MTDQDVVTAVMVAVTCFALAGTLAYCLIRSWRTRERWAREDAERHERWEANLKKPDPRLERLVREDAHRIHLETVARMEERLPEKQKEWDREWMAKLGMEMAEGKRRLVREGRLDPE